MNGDMRPWKLITRNLVFFRRTHLAVLLATAVCTAVLVGALVVGDSVPYSLKRIAETRLGSSEYAVVSRTRTFRSRLADRLSVRLGVPVAPMLNISGLAVRSESDLRIGGVEILGVDRRFWALGAPLSAQNAEEEPELAISTVSISDLGPGQAVINARLARRLDAKVGERILIRLRRPEVIPAEMPFALERERTRAARVEVIGIAGEEQFGRFSLSANQVSPFNLFVSIDWLSQTLDLAEEPEPGANHRDRTRANILLVPEGSGMQAQGIGSELQAVWQLGDIGLTLAVLPETGGVELRSQRVFLEQALSQAALAIGDNPAGIFTYLVNSMRAAGGGAAQPAASSRSDSPSEPRSTPYSFVSAPGPSILPPDMKDEQILINDWLAEDLQLSVGDRLELEYFVLGAKQELSQAVSTFTVRAIASITGPAGDRYLMPDFPGVAEVESSFDWEPGIPVDLGRIRDKDERYWERYRGTPKAFVTLAAARSMWENRFGDLTAVRYPAGGGGAQAQESIARRLLDTLDPETVDIRVLPVKEEGLQAGSGAVDFGQLFLGLSFFLLAAAVLLTALLYALGIEQRREETGLLRALGFTKRAIRRIHLAEGAFIALLGGVLGTVLGIGYNVVLLNGLNTLWRDAVGVSSLELYVRPSTLAVGGVSGFAIALVAMWITSTRQVIRSPAELQRPGGSSGLKTPGRTGRLLFLFTGVAAVAAGIVLVAGGIGLQGNPTGRFFLGGALLLIAALLLGYFLLVRLQRSVAATRISIPGIGLRGITRRSKRSLSVSGLLAFGIFIVLAVGANRLDPFTPAHDRSSGTGGFALYGETTVPISGDLNLPADRIRAGLPGKELGEVRFAQLRVHEGDDASCLNLNQVRNPRILAVRPEAFAGREAFSFVDHQPLQQGKNPWTLLAAAAEPGVIPAVVDQTVLTWGLHKSVGDTLTYTDERGREFKLEIVASLENSVFQGSVLISERNFIERFPSSSGTRVFLTDSPSSETEALAQTIQRALRDYGLELEEAARRLGEFNKVQNTYLSIFLLLGGLGLVLGSLGMGLVVARNVLERRAELALLRAVGFSRGMLKRILLGEHLYLLGFGLVSGLIAALAAVLPVILHRGTELPVAFLAGLIAAVAANGFLWTYLSVTMTTRGNLLPALRNE
jgi:putative ABC transport system permease protein